MKAHSASGHNRHYAKLDAARRTQSFRFCLYQATAVHRRHSGIADAKILSFDADNSAWSETNANNFG
jgi:hypothetical protein